MSLLDYTGKVSYFGNNYYFEMKNRNTHLKYSCTTEILNPVFDVFH